MMTQRDTVAAKVLRRVVKDAPPQTGTERTVGITFIDPVGNDRIRVLPDDAVGVSIGLPEVVFDCDNEDDYFRLLEEIQEFDVKT